ncbi:MAG: IclR family transcriptional regulator [Clostridium luticellarii]|uniref:IclR family transcriptional regulator n=1 Tax=Clostridium luticellarii TaxID=1691940 RepID=UPI0023567A06|nr:IclR family transcriptional regulator [Clostridium luticellarii]MCI1994726.1 IclR family transcriptional regulator [Clostridium luticellarii]MCI2038958.1 IclR family transcriptional regulator [Clostridium luticellarii]
MDCLNKAILRGLDILKFVGESEEPVTIAELSRYLEIPKTSVFNIVNSLVERDYLSVKDRKLKSYELGIGTFKLGSLYLSKTGLVNIADPILKWAADNVLETVFLAVVNNYELVYIYKKESKKTLRTTANLGSVMPLYSTGLGKAILATYDEVEINEYLTRTKLLPRTEKTLINREDLLEDLEVTRQRGYSICDEENEDGIFCIGVPVHDNTGKAIAAVSISSLKINNYSEKAKKHKEFAIKAALEISKRLGYTKERLF